jgi:hypothetical protein
MRWALVLLCLLVATPPVRAAKPRVALVIGAGAYVEAPKLPNPPRDATAVAEALRRLGFQTTLLLDPDRTAMERAIRAFGDASEGAEAAMLFYAGHALEAGGRNVLVPVSAHIASAHDLPFETVDLDLVLAGLDGRARTILLFLDSCRDNPFARTLAGGERGIAARGLAAPASDVTGTLIAFATAPGRSASDGNGDHSPFTTALLKHIEAPGVEVREMLSMVRKDVREATSGAQIPWEASALEGAFYFNPKAAPPTRVATAAKEAAAPSLAAASVPAQTRAANAPSPVTPSPVAPSPVAANMATSEERPHCHVDKLVGFMRRGGAKGTMHIVGDGRGCGFSVWQQVLKREPYEALAVTSAPSNGVVHIVDNRRIIYTPRKDYVGSDQFSVTSTPAGVVTMQVTVLAAQ